MMIIINHDEDLMDYMLSPFRASIPFADGELFMIAESFTLHTFQPDGYSQDTHVNGQPINITLVFENSVDEDGVSSRYAGRVVIYYDKSGKHYMMPTHQFRERYVSK